MTTREIIYMILDQARLVTDDITLNEEHALFLAKKIRAALLVQKYKTVKLEVADANYQVLCIGLEEVAPINGAACEGESYVRSTGKVPNRLNIGNDLVTPYDYLGGMNISLVPIEQLRYVGQNKFMRNIIYAAIGHDGYLYLKSQNPQFRYLKQVKLTGVFEDFEEASRLLCDETCELLDTTFPIEDALVNALVEAAVKELVGAAYRPKDEKNNANDDTPEAAMAKK